MIVTLTVDTFTCVSTFYTLLVRYHLMQGGKVEILATACGHDPPKAFPEVLKGIILMSWPLSQRGDQPHYTASWGARDAAYFTVCHRNLICVGTSSWCITVIQCWRKSFHVDITDTWVISDRDILKYFSPGIVDSIKSKYFEGMC